jgi:hypothetical protein
MTVLCQERCSGVMLYVDLMSGRRLYLETNFYTQEKNSIEKPTRYVINFVLIPLCELGTYLLPRTNKHYIASRLSVYIQAHSRKTNFCKPRLHFFR